MSLSRLKAMMLLNECTGVDIWPVDLCREKGVPEGWLEELADCFESGFDHDGQTIYYDEQLVNQFHGVRDIDLARRLARHLGIDTARARAMAVSRESEVRLLKEAVDE